MDDLEDWLSTKKRYAREPLGVSINNLDVTGYTASAFFQQTFASYISLLPLNLFTLLGVRKQTKVPILRNINGLIQGGEMLLVLGRPGSGCTTFLKTIAGYTHGIEVNDSSIHYQGIPYTYMHEILPKDTLYQSDEDIHLPELTLGETLSFAAEMRPDGVPSSETSLRIASVFHLQGVVKDRIGNDLIRGLSGGEKRRTSIAESFIGNSRIKCLDNSTRGLDSATALRLIFTLRKSADRLGSTIIMSIYQASEAMYSRFDKVLLLYEGRQIYFGSTSDASEYFTQLGFARPPRATTPDFLTSMSNPLERIARSGYEKRVPRTSEEFANAWLKSEQYEKLQHKLEEFNQMTRANPRVSRSQYYPTSLLHQINKCTLRAFKRLRNNVVPPISGIIGNSVVAIILGSVFFNLEENTASFEPRSILLFYSIMVNACVPAFEVLNMWAQRPIVEKHSRYVFYHPLAEGIASMIADLPNKIITSLCFNTTLYFMSNLRRTTAAFFTFWIYAFVAMVTMSMLFRMVGSLSRTYEQSLAPVGTMIFSFIIYAGFVIPPDYQVPWLGWIRWINPIGYAYESLMINEFRDRQFPCSVYAPSGPEYNRYGNDGKTCVAIGATPGQNLVEGNEFLGAKYGYHYDRVWNNLGFLFLLMVIFCAIHLVAAEKILAQRSRGDILLFRRSKATQKPNDEEEGEKEAVGFEVDTEEESTTVNEECDSSKTFQGGSSVFHWQNVSYEIKGKGDTPKVLLGGVTGWVRPGTLTALMGATGAGKTTLLDILADRKSVGIVRGHIHVDNQKCDDTFQGKTGYVQQADLHLPTATVREALNFSALLRRTSGTAAQKLAYVNTVLSMLDMKSYADAVIGVPGKGLNVEQRKRLTIAVEMAAKPEFLLFLDEPTSGLDSQTSWSICKLLRKLANEGLAIMCTIHQPSTQLFETFDRVLLLGQGKTIYFGDIGYNSANIFEYFQHHGARPCEEGENPAEWLLEVTSSSASPSYWPDTWKASEELAAVNERISSLKAINNSSGTSVQSMGPSHQEYAAMLSQQVVTVTYRAFQDYWRDPTYLYSKLALCVGPVR
jgi:ABC-type multidrug transport system ATPase subunit/ABC-type multidrug transport system permease subunit